MKITVTTMASHRGSRTVQPSVSSQVWETQTFFSHYFFRQMPLGTFLPETCPLVKVPWDPSGHQVFLIKAETQAIHTRPSTGLLVWQHLYPSNIWTLTASLGSFLERGRAMEQLVDIICLDSPPLESWQQDLPCTTMPGPLPKTLLCNMVLLDINFQLPGSFWLHPVVLVS